MNTNTESLKCYPANSSGGMVHVPAVCQCADVNGYVPGTQIKRPVVPEFGRDGNAFALMGQVSSALKRAGVPAEILTQFRKEATSGDYSNLIATCSKYADCMSDFGGDTEDEEEEDEDSPECEDCGEPISLRQRDLSGLCGDCEEDDED